MARRNPLFAAAFAFMATAMVTACGGGSGGGTVAPTVRLLYTADQDTDGVLELYLVNGALDSVVKVSGSLITGGNVQTSVFSADGSKILYRADQDTDEVFELYLVDTATPTTTVKVNSALVTDGDVSNAFWFTPDGTKILYLADQDTDGVNELYLVDLASPGTAQKVNGTLTANGNVLGSIRFSPDSSKILYRADQTTDNVFELFLVDVATPGTATRTSGALVSGGDVSTNYRFSADGSKIFYLARQDVATSTELYMVETASPGTSTQVNATLQALGQVIDFFQEAPNGTHLIYKADQDTDGVNELYLVDLASPGTAQKVNGTLTSGGNVLGDISFSPDGSKILYVADQDTDGVNELFVVATSTPGTATKVNSALVSGGDANAALFSPDSTRIVYRADQETDNDWDLYVVDLASPGTSTRLNGPHVTGRSVNSFELFPDGSGRLYYSADLDIDNVAELFMVDVATPGTVVKLNPDFPVASDLDTTRVTGDGSGLVFMVDSEQPVADVYEMFFVSTAAPGVAHKLSGPMVTGGSAHSMWVFGARD